MNRPELVIMAAGMGSRYGGMKQIDPMDDKGHIITDFSLYDAYMAGFRTVNFIIKEENEKDFRECIGDRLSKYMTVNYIYQKLDDIPEGYAIPEGRAKPWGTGHAIRSCRGKVNANFAVINADDYYGQRAFGIMYDFLANTADDDKMHYAMVGYTVENTLAENGSVSRGVCEVDPETSCLVSVTERTAIERKPDGTIAYAADGESVPLAPDTVVSMNLWGFTPSILTELDNGFDAFLEKGLNENPMKCEYFLPTVVDTLLKAGKADAKVMTSPDRWYGVTYREDKPIVKAAFEEMKRQGKYPETLLD